MPESREVRCVVTHTRVQECIDVFVYSFLLLLPFRFCLAAGGFDAIFALFLRPENEEGSSASPTPRSRIAQLWLEWRLERGSVCPLLLSAGEAAGAEGSEEGGLRLEPDL